MCLGLANGVKQTEFLSEKVVMGDLGKIYVPKKVLEKLGIERGQTLQITATENLIIIEKCESEGEDNG